ncbi:MAG: hypothetical protein PHV80_02320, partial [Rugosibacter sp.]|nr:hypothetical protein [Rugosibacter sp.]
MHRGFMLCLARLPVIKTPTETIYATLTMNSLVLPGRFNGNLSKFFIYGSQVKATRWQLWQ